MKYEAVKDKKYIDVWRVEAINYSGDGECYVAIFSGGNAEERAREYAHFKNRKSVKHE